MSNQTKGSGRFEVEKQLGEDKPDYKPKHPAPFIENM